MQHVKKTLKFLTSTDDVTVLGFTGMTNSSWKGIAAKLLQSFDCFKIRLGLQNEDPDDFFACGLLDDGELLWPRFTRGPWAPEIESSFCIFGVSNAFSLNVFVKSVKLSIFSISLLHFKQRWEERPFSLVTSNPSTCDSRPATLFCKDVFPSNRWKRPQPEIAILTLQTRQKSSTDVRKILTGVWRKPPSKQCFRAVIFLRIAAPRAIRCQILWKQTCFPRGPKPVWWDIWSGSRMEMRLCAPVTRGYFFLLGASRLVNAASPRS